MFSPPSSKLAGGGRSPPPPFPPEKRDGLIPLSFPTEEAEKEEEEERGEGPPPRFWGQEQEWEEGPGLDCESRGGVEGGGGKLGKLIDQMDGFIMGRRRREEQVEKERGKKDMKERGGS